MAFSLDFFVSHCVFCLVNLAFRTTIIEDTHLTLAVISFEAEANNSLIFLPLQTYKFAEKICRVSVSVGSIIPCLPEAGNGSCLFI